MSAIENRLYIIDGNALLHRAWHAIPPLTTKDGRVVNAAYGFAMVIDKLISEKKPTHLVVCWDVAGGTFRDEIYEDYKATRERKEDELYEQIDIIDEILAAHHIPSFGIEGYEADDLIGTIAEKVRAKEDTDTYIVTGDLDALQLVDDSTFVSFFVKGLSTTKLYDVEAVVERYGFGPEFIVDYKALRGDPSDNIPGVRGVGDKTATTLIKEFGGVDAIYKALESGALEGVVTASVQKKLEEDVENARMSHELATIHRDVPMTFSMKKAALSEPDMAAVIELYRDLEFTSLLRKLDQGTALQPSAPARSGATEVEVVIDRDGASVTKMQKQFAKASLLALDVRTHAVDLFGSSVTALAVADEQHAYVFATPSKETLAVIAKALNGTPLVTHDLKRCQHALEGTGIALAKDGVDLMVASYLVRAGSRSFDLETVLPDLVGTPVPSMPTAWDADTAYETFGQIVGLFPVACKEVVQRLEDAEMKELYEEIEHPLISILQEMEVHGVLLDEAGLKEMSATFEKNITRLQKNIWKLAGREFNVNSPAQLAEILFDDLELPTKGIKKTKSGYSTAASELDKLEEHHEIINEIRAYRELAKLKSTYIDALPSLADGQGRVHTSFNQTVAATGRLSSSDPNLQNIPIRTELGREIRKAFIAPKGESLIAADYSQIELRLVAAFSDDEAMVQIFKDGGDIHRATAAKVFDVKEEEVTKQQRRAAKAVNFGIIYGMGPRALSKNIEVTFAEAKTFIDKYFEAFPGVRQYLDDSLAKAQQEGYAETQFGRRRYLPDLESGVPMVRAGAERMATNMPLQGTAADIIKKAMIDIAAWLAEQAYGDDVVMVLQVHDELVFEVKDSLVDEVAPKIREMMEGVAALSVPLTVDVEVGKNWKEMKKI